MLCRKVYKFRLQPTALQVLALERTASVSRYIYNWALHRCQEHYQGTGQSKPWVELSAEINPNEEERALAVRF
jgi:transposase